MTNDYRALCAELVDKLHEHTSMWKGHEIGLVTRARALLDQPELCNLHREMVAESAARCARADLAQSEPEGPTDEELVEMWHSSDWFNEGATLREFISITRAAIARWGNHPESPDSSPQPVWDDIHYAWELHDDEGEWQAGGSAITLESAEREGNRYLQTYAQDGPHKLIIERHCVNIIEEMANG